MKILIIGLLWLSTCASVNGAESKFASVGEMVEEFSDYSSSNGTYKNLSSKPLHIQLSPIVVPGDYSGVIEEIIKRTIIYGVYRSFIHTDINQITVTAIPMEISFKGGEPRYLKGYERSITINRDKAEKLIEKYLKVSELSQLVTTVNISGTSISDIWTKNFDRINYNDQGYPGITRFFGDLVK